jgi:RNA polymerase primary sigma factor
MLEDPTQCPSFRLEQQDLATAANSALEMLTEREKKILMLQFGIEGSEQTFVEISKQFGVTNQRIRQIAVKALRKLRHPSRSQPLLQAIDPEEFEKREERIRARSCN